MTVASTPDEKELLLAEMDRDRHFRRLSQEARRTCLQEVLAYAGAAADTVAARHGRPISGGDIDALAIALTVRVETVSGRSMLPFLAEYSQWPTRIRLYDWRIRDTEERLRRSFPDFFTRFGLREMSLCHELFHHWERMDRGDTGRLVKVRVVRFGLFSGTHYVAAASEVASHVFVKALLNLDRSPAFIRPALAAESGAA